MGARGPGPIVAVWILADVAGCRKPPVEPPPEPSRTAAPITRVDHDPPPVPAVPPVRTRFVTPANPDVPPQPPVITRVTGRAARHDLGGGWTVKLEPAEITAAPGDEVEFSIDFRNARPGSGRPELHWSSFAIRWPDLKQKDRNNPSEWLPLQGGRTRGVLLASPNEWSYPREIYVDFRQRQRPGSLGRARMDWPRLNLDTATIVPVQVRHITDRCELPDGLADTVEGRQVSVYFSKPIGSGDSIRALGEFVVRRISGRATLVGFVDVYYTDIGSVGSPGTGCPHLQVEGSAFTAGRWMGAIEAQFTAPEPGPIDVVVFAVVGTADPRHVTAVLVE
jgi:hypothetical protein